MTVVEPTCQIELLGQFGVSLRGREVPVDGLGRRAGELIQLLALSAGHSLPRDQVIESLWPHLEPGAGAANLRKAAYRARLVLGAPDAVVLRGGQVALLPSQPLGTDAGAFERAATEALEAGDPAAAARAAGLYRGTLLPAAPYEPWTTAPREHLARLHVELLRVAGEWERIIELEPTDEAACVELMKAELAAGRRASAIRWFGRLRSALQRELGVAPGEEAIGVYDDCVAGLDADEPKIVGRQIELATVTALLRRRSPDLDLLAIRGPGGIGKSALCRETERLAIAEGWYAVSVVAGESGGAYAPLIEIVAGLVERRPELVKQVTGSAHSVLAELTPTVPPAPEPESPISRHRVIGALRRLLFAAAGDRPVLLVVDDAHLADAATIDALTHLGSRSGSPLVTVAAFRPEPAPEALRRGVARLARAGTAAEIDLGPLGDGEARALIDSASPPGREPGVADRIVDLADGNPYLLLELARSSTAGVPALIRSAGDAVAGRFIDLGEDDLGSLRRLALAGGDILPDAVVPLTGLVETDAFALLDRGLRSGLLVVSSGSAYRFRHELVRQALVGQVPPHERFAIHRETAARLEAAGAPAGLIAARWLDGERPSDAVPWLLAAARDAIRLGAFADAVDQLQPLLEHEPEHPEGLRLMAEAMDARGEAAAPAAYAAAARVADGPDTHELNAKRALATIKLGDPEGGLAILAGVEPTTLDGRVAHALAHAGAAALGAADPAMGTAMATEARDLAIEAGDPAAVTVASWAYAAAAHARGDLRASVHADITQTRDLGRLAVNVFDGQLCMTQRFLYGARPYPDVIAFLENLESEAARIGATRGQAFAVTLRGEAKLLSGRLDEADRDLAEGVELHRAIGAATGEAFALQRRSEVALHKGRTPESMAMLDEALAVARDSDVGFHLLDRIYGARVISAGDPDAGLAAVEEATDAVQGPIETCPTCRITLAVPAAIASARAGDLRRADEWIPVVEYLVRVVMRLPAWDAAFAEVLGHRAVAGDETETARGHFGEAVRGFEAAGQPLDAARCRALLSST